jgi:hypothetical protein
LYSRRREIQEPARASLSSPAQRITAVLNQASNYQRFSTLNLNVRPSGLAEAELKPEDGDVPVM